MTTTTWVILLVAAAGLGVLIAWLLFRTQRTKHLREQFGPEYRHTVDELGDRRKAEAELAARRARVETYHIRSLSKEERDRFLAEWRAVQQAFVDSPGPAVARADKLVTAVMHDRGYPMADFEHRAADLSVDHPHVIHTYRAAREIARCNERGEASTEDLRKATIYYRDLFEDLLEMPGAHADHAEVRR